MRLQDCIPSSQWISLLPSCPSESEAEAVSAAGHSFLLELILDGALQGRASPLKGVEHPTSGSHSVNNSPSKYSSRTGTLEVPATGLKLLLEISLCCEAIRDYKTLIPHWFPWHLLAVWKEQQSHCTSICSQSSALPPSIAMGFPLAANEEGSKSSPFTGTAENTPPLKVQEAQTNKSGKLNVEVCVGEWFISHNPTPKGAFLLPLPSNPTSSLFYEPWVPSGVQSWARCCMGHGMKNTWAPRGCRWSQGTDTPRGMFSMGRNPMAQGTIQVVSNLNGCLMLPGNDAM